MILLSNKLLNRFSKDRPSWQERYDRRLALLKFVGMRFWMPEDFALAGPMPPEIQRSVSAFPYGSAAASGAGGGGGDTLTLNTLSSTDVQDFGAFAGFRFQRDGHVEEYNNGAWGDQNPGTEWIDNNASTIGDDYEAKLDVTSGNAFSYSGGTWAENTYNTIDEQLQATLLAPPGATRTNSGTAYVREIAQTTNNVTASFSSYAESTGGGPIFL